MMPFRLPLLLTFLSVGAVLGGLAVPLLVAAWVTLTAPDTWRDGQSGFLLVFPIPTGMAVGATIASVLYLSTLNLNAAAAAVLLSAGVLLTAIPLIDAWQASDLRILLSPLFGWPFLWGAAFCAAGISSLHR
jgi:hypothetical protein